MAHEKIEFVLACPQAEIECDLHIKLRHGFVTSEGNSKTHVLKLNRNIYGQKQVGRVWDEYFVAGLRKIGF